MLAKDFFSDRLILLLGLSTIGLTLMSTLLVILRVDLSAARAVLRHWLVEGSSQFAIADPAYLYSFVVAAFIVLISSWAISYKMYETFRPASYFVFFFAQIVLLANFLISEALLRL